jgi:hypothetical protein
VQLLALQPQGLPAVVRPARAAAAGHAGECAGDLPVQQARHPAPLLPGLRLRAFGFGTDPKGNAIAAVNVRCLAGIEPSKLKIVPFDGRGL